MTHTPETNKLMIISAYEAGSHENTVIIQHIFLMDKNDINNMPCGWYVIEKLPEMGKWYNDSGIPVITTYTEGVRNYIFNKQ